MLVKSAGICYKSGPLVVINRVGTQLVFGSTSVFGVRGSVVFASTRKENNTNVLKRKHMPSWNPNNPCVDWKRPSFGGKTKGWVPDSRFIEHLVNYFKHLDIAGRQHAFKHFFKNTYLSLHVSQNRSMPYSPALVLSRSILLWNPWPEPPLLPQMQ